MLRQLEEFLGTHGTRHEQIEHREAFTSQEEAAVSTLSGWSWAKVVIVKEREGLAMAVLPACCTIDMDRLKGLIGRGEIELASVEEIIKTFPGCELGAIPPFGRLFRVPTFVEEALVDQREITMPAGDHRTAIRMRSRLPPSGRAPPRSVCRPRGHLSGASEARAPTGSSLRCRRMARHHGRPGCSVRMDSGPPRAGPRWCGWARCCSSCRSGNRKPARIRDHGPTPRA